VKSHVLEKGLQRVSDLCHEGGGSQAPGRASSAHKRCVLLLLQLLLLWLLLLPLLLAELRGLRAEWTGPAEAAAVCHQQHLQVLHEGVEVVTPHALLRGCCSCTSPHRPPTLPFHLFFHLLQHDRPQLALQLPAHCAGQQQQAAAAVEKGQDKRRQ